MKNEKLKGNVHINDINVSMQQLCYQDLEGIANAVGRITKAIGYESHGIPNISWAKCAVYQVQCDCENLIKILNDWKSLIEEA